MVMLVQPAYTTFHFDNARTGWNNHETLLTQDRVRDLHAVARYELDGEVDAQPLFYNGTAFVVTDNDTLYAVSPVRGLLWKRHFGAAVGAAYAGQCRATAPSIGIQSTPVIDPASDTIYLVAYTIEHGKPAYRLHALSAASGAERRSTDISRAAGDTYVHRQRAGLLESGGTIYIAFAGFCDHHASTTYGRMLAYSARDLTLRGSFVTTSSPLCIDVHMGTIWSMGFAPAADARGNVYFATGNGCIDYARVPDGGYSDAVLRLTPQLRLTDSRSALFAPCSAVEDNRHDQEMGAGGVVFTADRRFLIAGGKNGMTYVLDPANLGGFHTPCPDRVPFEAATNWGLWGGPVVFKSGGRQFVTIAGTGPHGIRTYEFDRGGARMTLQTQTGEQLLNGGESTVVTSDSAGSRNSLLLWALTRPTTGTMFLRAYDPLDLRRRLLDVPAGYWGNSGGYAAVQPTAVDGYVIVATYKQMTIWTVRPGNPGSPRRAWLYTALLALGGAALALAVLALLMRGRAHTQGTRGLPRE